MGDPPLIKSELCARLHHGDVFALMRKIITEKNDNYLFSCSLCCSAIIV
jgi:hypothetical protein